MYQSPSYIPNLSNTSVLFHEFCLSTTYSQILQRFACLDVSIKFVLPILMFVSIFDMKHFAIHAAKLGEGVEWKAYVIYFSRYQFHLKTAL